MILLKMHKKTLLYNKSLFDVICGFTNKNLCEKTPKRNRGIFAIAFSFLIVFLLAFSQKIAAQTPIVSDGFNGSTALFTRTGGAFFTGNSSATNDVPANSPFFSEGTGSVGVSNNGTLVLTATNNINTIGFSNIQLTFRLAAFSINSSSDGVDLSDIVFVEISTNGGTSYSTVLTVRGAPAESGSDNDVRWPYSATGVATTAYPTAAIFTPGTGGGTRSTDGYSTLTITSLPATNLLRVRITATNSNSTSNRERWVIDDFKITGIALPSITSFTPGNGCANTTPVIITGTNFTGATAVKFGGTNALSFTVNSATQITATPAAGTTGTISVTTPNGTGTSASAFTVNPIPLSSVNNQTNINCFSGSDGTLTILGGGGTGPYNYSVDNGANWTPAAPALPNPYIYTGLVANQAYRIRVKDANGCISK